MNEQPPIMGRLSRFLRGAPNSDGDLTIDIGVAEIRGIVLPQDGPDEAMVEPVAKNPAGPEETALPREDFADPIAVAKPTESPLAVTDPSKENSTPGVTDIETTIGDAPAADASIETSPKNDDIRIPTEPMTDRADIYRLVMAHRRRDPRPSTEIMKAVGGFDNQCTSMLNKGLPPTDAALVAVAAHYGIPTAIEPKRLRDMSHYAGLAKADVIGPEPLSREQSLKRAVDVAHGKADEHGQRIGGTSAGPRKIKAAAQVKTPPVAKAATRVEIQSAPSAPEVVEQDMASFLETATRLAGRIMSAEARAEAAEAARDEAIARADIAERREAASAKTLAELRAVLGGAQSVVDTTPAVKTSGKVVGRHEVGPKHTDLVVERMRGDILMVVGDGATWDEILSKLNRASSPYMMRARNLLLKAGLLIEREGVYSAA